MRTETRTEQRVITDTYTIYIADDGKEFENEMACENYEKDLKLSETEKQVAKLKINKLDGILPIVNNDEWRDVNVFWYNVNGKEDYEMIYNYYELCGSTDYFHEPEFYPAVMGVVDDGNYADVYYMDTIINQVK